MDCTIYVAKTKALVSSAVTTQLISAFVLARLICVFSFQTGYMFGKGVYFADMVTKSANYCRTSKQDPLGLMLLCEVALGNM